MENLIRIAAQNTNSTKELYIIKIFFIFFLNISYNKFHQRTTTMQVETPSQLMQEYTGVLFRMFDKDKSGKLDVKEMTALLNQVFEEFGEPMRLSPMHVGLVMKEADTDQDGQCSKEELIGMLQRFNKMGENPFKFGGAFAVPSQNEKKEQKQEQEKKQQEQKQEEKPQKKVKPALETPTLNMDQESFKKFKKELDDLGNRSQINQELLGVVVDKIFKCFDADKSGGLDCAQVVNFFRAFDADEGMLRDVSEFKLNLVFSSMDLNQDGKVSRDELVQFFKKNMDCMRMQKEMSSNYPKYSLLEKDEDDEEEDDDDDEQEDDDDDEEKEEEQKKEKTEVVKQKQPSADNKQVKKLLNQAPEQLKQAYEEIREKNQNMAKTSENYKPQIVPSWQYLPQQAQKVNFLYRSYTLD